MASTKASKGYYKAPSVKAPNEGTPAFRFNQTMKKRRSNKSGKKVTQPDRYKTIVRG